METRKFEIRNQLRKNKDGEEFLAYQVKTRLGWISLLFPQEAFEKFSDEIKEMLKQKFVEIEVPDTDLAWNIKNRNGFDVMYISEIISATELNFLTKKEKYFGK